MSLIVLETLLDAPLSVCFDAARNVDLHLVSAEQTNEKAVAGKTSGLLEKGDWVTWQARHFGIMQRLTVEITAMNPPFYFCDVMRKGAFKSMQHEHFFVSKNGQTCMTDKFYYSTPYGIFGKIFDWLILKSYMRRFLLKRNKTLKQFVEERV